MPTQRIRTIALVAHDNCKASLVGWVREHASILLPHHMVCTGTTGRLVREALAEALAEARTTALNESIPTTVAELDIRLLKSGPLGGDQQMGALIAEGNVDVLIFFWDPMLAQPHDVDVKALLRISSLYNLPTACNRATADYLITSPLLETAETYPVYDFKAYNQRCL